MIAVRNWPIYRPPVQQNINTGTYMDVIQEADRGNFWQRPDGAVSWQELNQYRDNLQRQIQFQETFGRIFGGRNHQQRLAEMRAKLDAANNMVTNYGNIAGAQDGNWQSISYGDVWATAMRDGNGHSVSRFDLGGGYGWPPPSPYPPVYGQPGPYFQNSNAGNAGGTF